VATKTRRTNVAHGRRAIAMMRWRTFAASLALISLISLALATSVFADDDEQIETGSSLASELRTFNQSAALGGCVFGIVGPDRLVSKGSNTCKKDHCYENSRPTYTRYDQWCTGHCWGEGSNYGSGWWGNCASRTTRQSTQTCTDTPKCRHCQGYWSSYGTCGSRADGRTDKGCGTSQHYKTYRITQEKGKTKDDRPCPHANGQKAPKSCSISCDKVSVSVGNIPTQVSSTPVNFMIRVTHPRLCGDRSTTTCGTSTSATANDVSCSATVQTPSGTIYMSNTQNLESPFNVPLAGDRDILAGTYKYSYTCHVLDQQTRAKIDGLSVSNSFNFKVARGCDSQLAPTVERVMEYTLLTSHAFLRASCDDTRRVKELIFREIDVSPADGAVTMNEIVTAAKKNGVDVPTVEAWFSGGDVKFSIAQFLEGTDFVHSHLCKDTASKIQFEDKDVAYPSSDVGLETSISQCKSWLKNMKVRWGIDQSIYKVSDTTCVYIDGALAARHEVTTNDQAKGWNAIGITNAEVRQESGKRQLFGISDTRSQSSRRVICVQTNDHRSCTGAMYYDGTAIDVGVRADTSGVMFHLRDTASDESAFEIERKVGGLDSKSAFSTVVLIESNIKGCATLFDSILYLDRDAILEPGSVWTYRVTTKFTDGHKYSAPVEFKTPWISHVEGQIFAGVSDVPVPDIRVCTEFQSFIENGGRFERQNKTGFTNFARIRGVINSDPKDKTAYTVTDGYPSLKFGSSAIKSGTYLRVDLGQWVSVHKIKACGRASAGMNVTNPHLAAYVSDHDPKSGRHGNECIVDSVSRYEADLDVLCVALICSGSKLRSFHGQYITIAGLPTLSNAVLDITEIEVYGHHTRCMYSSVTDETGSYEIDIKDATDQIPTKTNVYIAAYKEDIFPPTTEWLIDSKMSAEGHRETILTSAHKVLLVLVEVSDGQSYFASQVAYTLENSASLGVETAHNNSMKRTDFERFVMERCGYPDAATVVITDELWQKLDGDFDDVLNATEWRSVLDRMQQEQLMVEPKLVYRPRDVQQMRDFKMIATFDDAKNIVNDAIHNKRDSSWMQYLDLIQFKDSETKLQDANISFTIESETLKELRELSSESNETHKAAVEVLSSTTARFADLKNELSEARAKLANDEKALENVTSEFYHWMKENNGSIAEEHAAARSEWEEHNKNHADADALHQRASDVYDEYERLYQDQMDIASRAKSSYDSYKKLYEKAKKNHDSASTQYTSAKRTYDKYIKDNRGSTRDLSASATAQAKNYRKKAYEYKRLYDTRKTRRVSRRCSGWWIFRRCWNSYYYELERRSSDYNSYRYYLRKADAYDAQARRFYDTYNRNVETYKQTYERYFNRMSSEKKKMGDYTKSMNAQFEKQKVADDLAAEHSKAMSDQDLVKANRLLTKEAHANALEKARLEKERLFTLHQRYKETRQEYVSLKESRNVTLTNQRITVDNLEVTLSDAEQSVNDAREDAANKKQTRDRDFLRAEEKQSTVDELKPNITRYANEAIAYASGIVQATAKRQTCENMVLVRISTPRLPTTSDGWNDVYTKVIESDKASLLSTCRAMNVSVVDPVEIGSANASYIMPILWFKSSANRISLKTLKYSSLGSDSNSTNSSSRSMDGGGPPLGFEDGQPAPESLFYRVTKDNLRVRLRATKQLPDIVHVFDRGPKSKANKQKASEDTTLEMAHIFSDHTKTSTRKLPVRHKRVHEKIFTDDTVAIVVGAVMFPRDLVGDSTDCGVPNATVEVFEPDQKPDEYKTDARGWFEIALARGKTFNIRVKYEGHVICYAGKSIEDAMTNTTLCSSESAGSYVTLSKLGDGETVFFADTTSASIDLGLYEGECDVRYNGVTFKVSPINGCHDPIFFSSDKIAADWATTDALGERVLDTWPLAAMDYTVELYDAPEVEAELKASETCEKGVGGIMEYFRGQETLNRLALLQDNLHGVTLRYEYHGYLCIRTDNLDEITDEKEVCVDEDGAPGKLTVNHLVGQSSTKGFWEGKIATNGRDFKVSVFELHMNLDASGQPVRHECIESLPHDESGSTTLSFRQSVTDEGDNKCHPNRGGDETCDFQVQLDSDGLVIWPETGENYVSISPGLPNLAGNHRRSVDVSVERFDNIDRVTVAVQRQLVSLGSKPRGGGGLSDDEFWATVPIEGLVYTVVHDPPGGNSFAELSVGTKVGISMLDSGSRSASEALESAIEIPAIPADVTTEAGVNTGVAVEGSVSLPIKWFEGAFELENSSEGPEVKMTSTLDDGFSLDVVTDRAIRSSQDPGTAGRAGDVILGGGVELVYKLSDVLDVVKDGRTLEKPCLFISVSITWLPRKPTTYILNVANVETKIIPNLKFLWSVVMENRAVNAKAKDESKRYFKCAQTDAEESVSKCTDDEINDDWAKYLREKIQVWQRTLEWSAPTVHLVKKNGGQSKKDFSSIDRIMVPLDSEDNPVGASYKKHLAQFNQQFFEDPLKDIFDAVSQQWDQTIWMLPYNGIGPPPLFLTDGKIGGFYHDDYVLDNRFWEPKKPDSKDWQRMTGNPGGWGGHGARAGRSAMRFILTQAGKIIGEEKTPGDPTLKPTPPEDLKTDDPTPKPTTETTEPTTPKPTTETTERCKGYQCSTISSDAKHSDPADTQKRIEANQQRYKDASARQIAERKAIEANQAADRQHRSKAQQDVNRENRRRKNAGKEPLDRTQERDYYKKRYKEHKAAAKDAASDAADDASKKTASTATDAASDAADDASKKTASTATDAASDAADDAAKKAASTATDVVEDAGMMSKAKAAKAKLKVCLQSKACQVVALAAVSGVIAGIMAGIAEGTGDGTYPYVSYPRQTFKESIPDFANAFMASDFLQNSVNDLKSEFTSCSGVVCEESEFKKKTFTNKDDSFGEDPDKYRVKAARDDAFSLVDTRQRLQASFTGGKALTGMRDRGGDESNSAKDMLITFSGGGHAVDYAFLSEQSVEDRYGVGVSFSGEAKNKYKLDLGGLIGYAVMIGMMLGGIDSEGTNTFTKSIENTTYFMWNSRNATSTLYSLGDPELGDKFIIKVGADKRFGTPVFSLQGGRSSCPGEALTVWREQGIEMSLSTMPFNKYLDPNERAVLRFIVDNGTPYREASLYGLRIVDGLSESVNAVISAAHDALFLDGATGATVSQAINETAAKTIAKNSDVMQKIISDAALSASKDTNPPAVVVAVAVQSARSAPPNSLEMSDVEFKVNGEVFNPLQGLMPFKYVDYDDMKSQRIVKQTAFTLSARPLNPALRKIQYLQLRLQSLCETELAEADGFTRDPIGVTAYLQEMTWSQYCPQVSFDGTTMARHEFSFISPTSAAPLKLKVFNPNRHVLWPASAKGVLDDAMNSNLKLVRVQYRPVGAGEWVSARSDDSAEDDKKKNLLCPYSRSDGCGFNWDVNNRYEQMLSGFKDGVYEVRVKTFCFGGHAFAHPDVHSFTSPTTLSLTIDTVRPIVHQSVHSSEALSVTVEYHEEIQCSKHSVSISKIMDDACAEVDETIPTASIKRSFVIKCFNTGGKGHWVMKYPSGLSGTFKVTLDGVQDFAGNDADKVTINFSPGGKESTDCASVICPVNTHVDDSHTCKPCHVGFGRAAGDDSRRDSTTCVECLPGYYFDESEKTCTACATSKRYGPGYASTGGALETTTTCNACAPDHHVSSPSGASEITCTKCPPGSTSFGGDVQSCTPTYCDGQFEHVVNHECVKCPMGTMRNAVFSSEKPGDDASASDTECNTCAANFYRPADGASCKACPLGTSKPEGNGNIDACVAVECKENHFVQAHACVPCPSGFSRAQGDKTDQADTTCDLCAEDHYVDSRNSCSPCEKGYTSTFFKNETRKGVTRFTSGVTTCDACAQNYAVTLDEKSDKLVCSPCAQGYVRDSRDVVASGETKCTECAEGYHVQQRGSESVCVQCDIGRVPSLFEVHDVQANSETWCLPKICELDEYVSAGECKRCKTGYIRAVFSVDTDVLGDDATKGDTACTLCTENYRVAGNVESGFTCEPCGGHGTSKPGANVTESLQTECDFDLCPVNTRAFNRTCVPCAKGYENKAGDDPLAGDLPCKSCAENHRANGFAECVPCAPGTTREAGDDRFGPVQHCAKISTKSPVASLGRLRTSRPGDSPELSEATSVGSESSFSHARVGVFISAVVGAAAALLIARRKRNTDGALLSANAPLAPKYGSTV